MRDLDACARFIVAYVHVAMIANRFRTGESHIHIRTPFYSCCQTRFSIPLDFSVCWSLLCKDMPQSDGRSCSACISVWFNWVLFNRFAQKNVWRPQYDPPATAYENPYYMLRPKSIIPIELFISHNVHAHTPNISMTSNIYFRLFTIIHPKYPSQSTSHNQMFLPGHYPMMMVYDVVCVFIVHCTHDNVCKYLEGC